MSFRSNPLSLSLQEPALESWLRDSGYLEVLDQRSSSSSASASASASAPAPESSGGGVVGIGLGFFSHLGTLVSLFTFNPFAKLTTEDFSGQTPSWTHGFLGSSGSYSLPSSPTQARLRVQENVKRFARNYASLFILFFACTLYQMPFALVGLLSSLALWDFLKFSDHNWGWGFNQRPRIRICLIRIAQCATAVILLFCNVPMALFYSMAVGYVVLMLHAAFRKLASTKQPHRKRK